MKGIILAAGRGRRMGSFTKNQPKCRTKVKGRALIQWQMDSLHEAGIQDLSIVRGYLAESFNFDLHYFDNLRWKETNMVVSLLSAREWLRSFDCIVTYSDIIFSANAIRTICNKTAEIVVAYDPKWINIWKLRFSNPLLDAETFKLDGDKILEIGGKTANIDTIEGQYMGIIKFSPKIWKEIEEYLFSIEKSKLDRLDITTLLQELINNGMSITAEPIKDKWFEFDNQRDLEVFKSIEWY